MSDSYTLSTIACEERGSLCEDLNPDKVNIVNRPWLRDPLGEKDRKNSFFNKNEFGLEEEIKTVFGIDKEECARIALDNNYAGFIYYGDKNKCYQYNDTENQFNSPIDDILLNNNEIEIYFRTKSTSSIDKEDQHNYDKYFTPVQTMGFTASKYSEFDVVPQKIDCMEKCVKNGRACSSIMYGQQLKKCVFYAKKDMKSATNKIDNEVGDVYTVITNKLNEYKRKMDKLKSKIHENGDLNYCTKINTRCAFDRVADSLDLNKSNYSNKDRISDGDLSLDAKVPLYNCNGIYSTNPFCTKQYDPSEPIQDNSVNVNMYYTDCFEIDTIKNQTEKKKFLSELCKDKYGKEYTFNDDIFNMNSVVKCEESDGKSKKALCKMDFSGIVQPFITNKIEHFENKEEEYKTQKNINMKLYNANIFKATVLLLLLFIVSYLTWKLFNLEVIQLVSYLTWKLFRAFLDVYRRCNKYNLIKLYLLN